MPKIIEHISGSFLNSFDYDKKQFIDNYVYGIKTPDNKHFKFGRDYEDLLGEKVYTNHSRQEKLLEYFEGYEVLGFYDFVSDDEIIEVKTKNGWWSKNDITKSWQFRLYNHYRGDKKFLLHQYNKKLGQFKVMDIGWEDEFFVPELRCKIKEIEEFLKPYGVIIGQNLNLKP